MNSPLCIDQHFDLFCGVTNLINYVDQMEGRPNHGMIITQTTITGTWTTLEYFGSCEFGMIYSVSKSYLAVMLLVSLLVFYLRDREVKFSKPLFILQLICIRNPSAKQIFVSLFL